MLIDVDIATIHLKSTKLICIKYNNIQLHKLELLEIWSLPLSYAFEILSVGIRHIKMRILYTVSKYYLNDALGYALERFLESEFGQWRISYFHSETRYINDKHQTSITIMKFSCIVLICIALLSIFCTFSGSNKTLYNDTVYPIDKDSIGNYSDHS